MESHPKPVTLHDPAAERKHATLPYPLGPTITSEGTNFSVFSASATRIELVLFDEAEDSRPSHVIGLDPVLDRTSHYWHIFLPGIRSGQLYGYRADGPNDPAYGQRFDSQKVLIDPYGKSVSVGQNYDRAAACKPGDNAATCMKSVLADLSTFDWEGDQPLYRPFRRSVIYEMHVAGFTRHPNSGVTPANRGTYLGVVEKIPYLQELGITAIELLPVYQFDAGDASPKVSNYWGYDPISFFAPHVAYSASRDPLGCLDEFRTMVKELHRAGIEVILDVVYNHTAEGNERGPTLSFKGIDNASYYRLLPEKRYYINDTGTGNTLNLSHPNVLEMVTDSLRYWASELHVDGFRFDLGTILAREPNGFDNQSGFLKACNQDPLLRTVKLIAEPWDCGPGGYQVGGFPPGWAEWNDRFRDTVRDFWKGSTAAAQLSPRLCASGDIFNKYGRRPSACINFLTAHDGFTLADLVAYNEKHNEANGEDNRDGTSDNRSWNCGTEGPTDDPGILALRDRQSRNLLATLLLAQGTPMLLAGDECGRTQQGNNNAYCQDNAISWLDWNVGDRGTALADFVRRLCRLRHQYPILRRNRFLTGDLDEELDIKDLTWINASGNEMRVDDWADESMRCFGMLMDGRSRPTGVRQRGTEATMLMVLNAHHDVVGFHLPDYPVGTSWALVLDTNLAGVEPTFRGGSGEVYQMTGRSLALFARTEG
jgi:glycogen operon protein